MSKELSLLEIEKHLKDFVFELEMGKVDEMFISNSFEIIETALKALEIIKGFVDFNVYEMQGKYYLTTGNNYRGQISISKDQYDLLKEVLKDD